MPKKPQKGKPYLVKIRDGAGDERQYYSDDAPTHAHGNSLASALIEHFSAANPGGRYHTVEVTPSKNLLRATKIRWRDIDGLVW